MHIIKISNEYQIHMIIYDKTSPMSSSWREVSPAESLRRRAKVLLPKFRLEIAAHHPESLLYIFSRANGLIYQKMGARGWPGAPRATRARLGGGTPWCLVGTWVAPSGTSFFQYFLFVPK